MKKICNSYGIPKEPEEFNRRYKSLSIGTQLAVSARSLSGKTGMKDLPKSVTLKMSMPENVRCVMKQKNMFISTFQLIPVKVVASPIQLFWSFIIDLVKIKQSVSWLPDDIQLLPFRKKLISVTFFVRIATEN